VVSLAIHFMSIELVSITLKATIVYIVALWRASCPKSYSQLSFSAAGYFNVGSTKHLIICIKMEIEKIIIITMIIHYRPETTSVN
jgi:hypothetical protein